jgi:hypothetical protein
MKIRIERIDEDVLKVHRLYGEGVKVNEIQRPQPDELISALSFDKLELLLRGDRSMIVDVSDPVVKPRTRYAVPRHAVEASEDSAVAVSDDTTS